MKNKLVIILSILMSYVAITQAQNEHNKRQGHVGISYASFGQNDVYRSEELIGSASYNSDHFFTIGLNYIHPITAWLETETGIEYSKHSIIIRPNLPPDMDNSPFDAQFSLINIPFMLRVNFFKYFFINGGALLDIDTSPNSPIDEQTGLGFMYGAAIKYDFKKGVSIYVNSYTKMHSIIPFSGNDHHQKIWENGVRIGISYDLAHLKLTQ